jgi:DamX protein
MSNKQTQQFNHRGHALPGSEAVASHSGRSIKSQEQFKQYLSNYRFERDPFSDAGASGLFFAGGGRKEAVESLLHYSRYGSTPVFLTGHIGCGKTTTLKALISELESDVDVAVVPALLMVTPSQFFIAMAKGFGAESMVDSVMDLAAITQQLLALFKDNAISDKQSFLCIDNIQDLPSDVVSALFELLSLADGDLGILFIGELAATVMLESAAEQSDLLLNRIELASLDQQDVSAYVKYRLDAVGYNGEFPLTEMQLRALTYRSQGSLTQIHSVARSMLIAGMDNVKNERSPFPITHLLALIFLTLLIVIGWRHEKTAEVVAEPDPIVLEPAVLVQAKPVKRAATVDNDSSGINAAVVNEVVSPESSLLTGKTAAEVKTALKVLAADAANVSRQPVAARDPLLPPESAEVISANSQAEKLNTVEPVVLGSATEAVMPEEVKTYSAHKRLIAWPQVGYALQIFGTHNAKRAKQLVEQYFGEADLLFYETRHNGRPWYVVVNGPYTGRESAKLSIEQLPEGLQRLRPWPRNIASIQADIRRFSAAVAADQ